LHQHFLLLSRRFGGDMTNPTEDDLEAALREVFEMAEPGLAGAEDGKSQGAFLQFGPDTGPIFVLYAHRKGELVLEQWVDAKFEREAAAPMGLSGVGFDYARRLWKMACDGNISGLRMEPWLKGYRC
jgi:hypothetical protein